jgi:signal peptidase II
MILYYLLAAVLIAIDQLVKWGIVQNFALYDELEVIPNIFSLYYIQNRGAAWGILQGRMGLFFIITVLVVGYLVYTFHNLPQRSILAGISFSFILAGALGNFIDRMRLGYVVDMLRFDFIDFPIFNVADVFLTIGVGYHDRLPPLFRKRRGHYVQKGVGRKGQRRRKRK